MQKLAYIYPKSNDPGAESPHVPLLELVNISWLRGQPLAVEFGCFHANGKPRGQKVREFLDMLSTLGLLALVDARNRPFVDVAGPFWGRGSAKALQRLFPPPLTSTLSHRKCQHGACKRPILSKSLCSLHYRASRRMDVAA